MNILSNDELILIKGGAFNITGTLLTALSKTLNTIFDIGKSLGTSLNMILGKKTCN